MLSFKKKILSVPKLPIRPIGRFREILGRLTKLIRVESTQSDDSQYHSEDQRLVQSPCESQLQYQLQSDKQLSLHQAIEEQTECDRDYQQRPITQGNRAITKNLRHSGILRFS